MKTLDEVIEHHEYCLAIGDSACGPNCRWREKDGVCRMREDALHYLKEYQAILPLVPSLINTAIAVQKKGKTIG